MLADLESVERRIVQTRKRATGKDKEAMTVLPVMEKALALLREGKPVRLMLDGISAEDLRLLQGLNLLTSKPVLYVCNVAEADAASGNAHSAAVEKMAAAQGARTVIISAPIEAEVAQLPEDEAREFLDAMGLAEPGLDRLIRAGYDLLDLITYFTAGPKETRAWTITRGTKTPQAAGVIHTDFERGFIRAQTIAYEDYVSLGGEGAAKEAGKARDEGKEYVVQDGDILLFRFNT
jgi:GTP-binding protein YchF